MGFDLINEKVSYKNRKLKWISFFLQNILVYVHFLKIFSKMTVYIFFAFDISYIPNTKIYIYILYALPT